MSAKAHDSVTPATVVTDAGSPAGPACVATVDEATSEPRLPGLVPPQSGRRAIGDRYRVMATIGEGTAGVVYRCRHAVVGREVAIKVLRNDFIQDDSVRERFANEARAASEIDSLHIVETLDFGRLDDGSTYIVMELLEGETLGALCSGGRLLSFERVLRLMRQVVTGLGAAHRAGIVHRDVKPDNIFVVEPGTSDFVKILDFGVAKMASSQASLTRAGTIFGTPHYMSPEQAGGVPADERADVYSVGVILYQLACGVVPFDAEAPLAILTQHMTEPPAALALRAPTGREVPRGYEAVVLKCLEKEPERRYESMAALDQELERLQAGGLTAAAKTRAAGEGAPFLSRSQWLTVLSICGLFGALGLGLALGKAEGESVRTPAVVAVPPAVASLSLEVAPATAERPPNPFVTVDLVLFPLDAHAFLDDEDLGPMPVSVRVPVGEKRIVMVKRKDYISRRIVLDGKSSRLVVGLRHLSESDWMKSLKEREANNTPQAVASEEVGGLRPSPTVPLLGGPQPDVGQAGLLPPANSSATVSFTGKSAPLQLHVPFSQGNGGGAAATAPLRARPAEAVSVPNALPPSRR